MATLPHVRDSVCEVTESSWVIGEKLLLTRGPIKTVGSWADDEEGFYYSVSELSGAQIDSRFTNSKTRIRPVYDVGDVHAVWKIGKAYLKVKIIKIANETREHVTLDAIKGISPSFNLPEVLFYGEWEGRYYLVLSQVPGETIAKAWPTMEEDVRTQCIEQMVKICQELAVQQSDRIVGVDGNELGEYYLTKHKAEDFTATALQRKCESLGMTCSRFFLYHTDLGPTNVLIDRLPNGRISLGIIDWEAAGFVPREWIRTKFRLSGGMDLECYIEGDGRRHEWRKRIQLALGDQGFSDVAEKWVEQRDL